MQVHQLVFNQNHNFNRYNWLLEEQMKAFFHYLFMINKAYHYFLVNMLKLMIEFLLDEYNPSFQVRFLLVHVKEIIWSFFDFLNFIIIIFGLFIIAIFWFLTFLVLFIFNQKGHFFYFYLYSLIYFEFH